MLWCNTWLYNFLAFTHSNTSIIGIYIVSYYYKQKLRINSIRILNIILLPLYSRIPWIVMLSNSTTLNIVLNKLDFWTIEFWNTRSERSTMFNSFLDDKFEVIIPLWRFKLLLIKVKMNFLRRRYEPLQVKHENFEHVSVGCFKLALSKFLGLGIIGGSLLG